ncbi:MAG: cytochrome c [Magnetococcales bacterium]|nr:cytochrome c [Magnetococcales bacterium]NGZ25796.1 cytochrome c [Magnetococcales bacterium]
MTIHRCKCEQTITKTVRRSLAGLIVAGGLLWSPWLQSSEVISQKEQYIESVVTILRLHAQAIRQLATHEFKYSGNLARHVTALHNTFGLLGPMDWHAAKAVTLQKKDGSAPVFQQDSFEKMAEQCLKSMKELYQISIQQMETKGSPQPVLQTLQEVQSKCDACHNLLEGAAPDVWGHAGR